MFCLYGHQGYFVGKDLVAPLPYQLWDKSSRHWITALYVALSVAWALEIVSHLEGIVFNIVSLLM